MILFIYVMVLGKAVERIEQLQNYKHNKAQRYHDFTSITPMLFAMQTIKLATGLTSSFTECLEDLEHLEQVKVYDRNCQGSQEVGRFTPKYVKKASG